MPQNFSVKADETKPIFSSDDKLLNGKDILDEFKCFKNDILINYQSAKIQSLQNPLLRDIYHFILVISITSDQCGIIFQNEFSKK